MVKIYCDCADLPTMEKYVNDPQISGFTTNPSLMLKAGIRSYRAFAKNALNIVRDKPISLEALADDFDKMGEQAKEIASWGENVYVKIPITNTKGESSRPLIERLADLNLNVTAVMTSDQINNLEEVLKPHHILSIFVGRISDAGYDIPIGGVGECQYLWASTRQVSDVYVAEEFGYGIITLSPDLIAKLPLKGKDLTLYSLETVKQFHEDGKGIEF